MDKSSAANGPLPMQTFWTVCPNCGTAHMGFHNCPALRDLSPMGGGPNPWKDKPR